MGTEVTGCADIPSVRLEGPAPGRRKSTPQLCLRLTRRCCSGTADPWSRLSTCPTSAGQEEVEVPAWFCFIACVRRWLRGSRLLTHPCVCAQAPGDAILSTTCSELFLFCVLSRFCCWRTDWCRHPSPPN